MVTRIGRAKSRWEVILHQSGGIATFQAFLNEKKSLRYSDVRRRTKGVIAWDKIISRRLKDFVDCGVLRHEGRDYTLMLNETQKEEINNRFITPYIHTGGWVKENDSKYWVSIGDLLQLQSHSIENTQSYAGVTVYGLKREILLSKSRNGKEGKGREKALQTISSEDLFQGKSTLTVGQAVQNLLLHLLKQKMGYREPKIKDKFLELVKKRKYARVRPLIVRYVDFWTHFMNDTDVTGHFIEECFERGWPGQTRPIDYSSNYDVLLLEGLIPRNKRRQPRRPIASLREKYPVFITMPGKEIPFRLLERLEALSDLERRLFITLIDEVWEYLLAESLYPSNISVIGHCRGGMAAYEGRPYNLQIS